jgi:acyl CoA:acetate/3-ketoacid CoA transferase beta subunit
VCVICVVRIRRSTRIARAVALNRHTTSSLNGSNAPTRHDDRINAAAKVANLIITELALIEVIALDITVDAVRLGTCADLIVEGTLAHF